MELKDFIKKFLKFTPLLIILTIAGGVGGGIFNQFQIPQYKTSVLVYFAPREESPKSANEFTDTILGVLQSQGFENSLKVETRKTAPQLIEFKISGKTQDKVQNFAKNLPKNLETNLEKFFGSQKTSIIPVTDQLVVDKPKSFLFLNLLVGAASGFVLGVALSSTIIYFKA